MPAIVVPLAAPHVAALATWRDAVVPVVDFRCEDVLSSRHRRERSLIVRYQGANGGGLLAIAVDPDVALHRATAADRQLTPRSAQPSFVSGVFTVGRCPVALLDVDALA